MLTKIKNQKLIEKYKQIMLFPGLFNQGKKPTVIWQSDLILPSLYLFKSSHQINTNIMTTIKMTHQSSIQQNQNMSKQSQNQWPQSCIGLIICEHHQNNQIFYVYGTGTLIYNNIVLTSAQNVYCRRSHTQYINMRFATCVNGKKCSGIYEIKQVHYPKEYTMEEDYENYDFSVLQLYNDLSHNCGYVGWKAAVKPADKQVIAYGYYMSKNEEGSFKLQQIRKKKKEEQYNLGDGLLIKGKENMYYIIGLHIKSQTKQFNMLSKKMRSIINQWTKQNIINLKQNKIGVEGCKQLIQVDQIMHLNTINLEQNSISAQGCKYLSQINWTHLDTINLGNRIVLESVKNNIGAQGCKYLSQANWINLTEITLEFNNIGAQGCMYLSEVNWTHLSIINLFVNYIGAQGCKFLSRANWIYLTKIQLNSNKIGVQGCMYLSKANWNYLTTIRLNSNNILAQGCKYLSQSNWSHLTTITLDLNQISTQGCKYLSQAYWKYLTTINLWKNNIDDQGCKYLMQGNWIHLSSMLLSYNNINKFINKTILKQLWKNADIQI